MCVEVLWGLRVRASTRRLRRHNPYTGTRAMAARSAGRAHRVMGRARSSTALNEELQRLALEPPTALGASPQPTLGGGAGGGGLRASTSASSFAIFNCPRSPVSLPRKLSSGAGLFRLGATAAEVLDFGPGGRGGGGIGGGGGGGGGGGDSGHSSSFFGGALRFGGGGGGDGSGGGSGGGGAFGGDEDVDPTEAMLDMDGVAAFEATFGDVLPDPPTDVRPICGTPVYDDTLKDAIVFGAKLGEGAFGFVSRAVIARTGACAAPCTRHRSS